MASSAGGADESADDVSDRRAQHFDGAGAEVVIVRHRLGERVVTCKNTTKPKAARDDGGALSWNVGTLGVPDQTCRIRSNSCLIAQNRGPMNCHGERLHLHRRRRPSGAGELSRNWPSRCAGPGQNRRRRKRPAGHHHPPTPATRPADAVKITILLPDGIEHGRGKIVDYEVGTLQPKDTKALQLVLPRQNPARPCAKMLDGHRHRRGQPRLQTMP